MFSRRPGARFNRGRVPAGPATPSVPWENDLRVGLGSDKLAYWHRAEHGITLDSAMHRTGTGTGTLTLSGPVLTSARPVHVDVAVAGQVGGTLTVYYAYDENGADRVGPVAVPTTTLSIGDGNAVTFQAATTYTADNVYYGAVKQHEPLFGATGAAGGRLDNSTVTASSGIIYEAHGIETGTRSRASVRFMPGMLGNQGSFGSAIAGLATPFDYFYLGEVSPTLPNTTAVLALFGWLSQTVAGSHIIDWILTGTTGTPANSHGIQRINSTPTTQRYNSDGSTGGYAAVPVDLNPHIFSIHYNGSIMTARIDGFEVATGSWTGTVTCNRYTEGAVKAGGGAATAFLTHRKSDGALYLGGLSAAEVTSVIARLA